MTPCKMRLKCPAPLCPEQPKTMKRKWRPYHSICKNRKYKGLSWVMKQKEIAKLSEKAYSLNELMEM